MLFVKCVVQKDTKNDIQPNSSDKETIETERNEAYATLGVEHGGV